MNAIPTEPRDKAGIYGIKTALALVAHEPAEVGFCSLRTITFDGSAAVPRIASVELTHEEAQSLHDALGSLLPKLGPGR